MCEHPKHSTFSLKKVVFEFLCLLPSENEKASSNRTQKKTPSTHIHTHSPQTKPNPKTKQKQQPCEANGHGGLGIIQTLTNTLLTSRSIVS